MDFHIEFEMVSVWISNIDYSDHVKFYICQFWLEFQNSSFVFRKVPSPVGSYKDFILP